MSEKIAEGIIDFANAIEAACVQLKRYVGEQQIVGVREEIFTQLLGWTQSKGERLGEFEWCSREANNDSDAFNHAINILKRNDATIKNQLKEDSWRYNFWHYEDRIFRRLRKGKTATKKEASASVEKPQEQDKAVEKVKQYFPKTLEELLTFEKVEDHIIIKPRQYLGSENFAKIASIVRDNDGEYISAGKESHFKVPVKN